MAKKRNLVRLTKSVIKKALGDTKDYQQWELAITEARGRALDMNTKMLFVMQGLSVGVTLETALDMMGISAKEYKEWKKGPVHRSLIKYAMARADAILEHIVYSYAKQDPKFALQVLVKRNPKRWNRRAPIEVKKPKEEEKKPLPVLNVGSFLEHKEEEQSSDVKDAKEVVNTLDELNINIDVNAEEV